jgi:hypothetical protein
MDHQEIRFQILYYLYNKHYSGEFGTYQSIDGIVRETELRAIERNLIRGNVDYLKDSGFIKGRRMINNYGYPKSVVITNYGIQTIENVIKQIIKEIKSQQQDNEDVQNKIDTISADAHSKNRVNRIWEYIKSKPEFFSDITERALKIYLSEGVKIWSILVQYCSMISFSCLFFDFIP